MTTEPGSIESEHAQPSAQSCDELTTWLETVITEKFANQIQEIDVHELAARVKQLAPPSEHSSLLLKLSFALAIAATSSLSEQESSGVVPSGTNNALDLGGIWQSRYSYFNSGLGKEFDSTHHVIIRQNGKQLSVESLPDRSGSEVKLSLAVNGSTVGGTWEEKTSPSGYYQGAIYRGAIQLVASQSGDRLVGKWVSLGKNFRINIDHWEFTLETRSTSRSDIARYTMRDSG